MSVARNKLHVVNKIGDTQDKNKHLAGLVAEAAHDTPVVYSSSDKIQTTQQTT